MKHSLGEYRTKAHELYGSESIEIDPDAEVSSGDDGVFVQAWVWVADDTLETDTTGE